MTSSLTHAPTPPGAGVFASRASTPRAAADRHLLALEGLTRDALHGLLDAAARERDWLRLGEPDRGDLAGVTVMLASRVRPSRANR